MANFKEGDRLIVCLNGLPSFWRGRAVREEREFDLYGQELDGIAVEQTEEGILRVSLQWRTEQGKRNEVVPLTAVRPKDLDLLSFSFVSAKIINTNL